MKHCCRQAPYACPRCGACLPCAHEDQRPKYQGWICPDGAKIWTWLGGWQFGSRPEIYT